MKTWFVLSALALSFMLVGCFGEPNVRTSSRKATAEKRDGGSTSALDLRTATKGDLSNATKGDLRTATKGDLRTATKGDLLSSGKTDPAPFALTESAKPRF